MVYILAGYLVGCQIVALALFLWEVGRNSNLLEDFFSIDGGRLLIKSINKALRNLVSCSGCWVFYGLGM